MLSFLEGASVMAAELLGAKMLAPYFGSSLYVWASVLAITLGGLAVGYFAGGILSEKSKRPLALFYVLLAAATFTLLMPASSKLLLWLVGMHRLMPAVLVSSFCILFPPVFLMGMVSPLIIRRITTGVDQAGRIAGSIYAISTVGGILATLSFGFYIIPYFGLTYPAIFTGVVLGILPLWVLISQRKSGSAIGFFLLASWAFFSNSYSRSEKINLLYESEGLLGQLMVIDYPHYATGGKEIGKSRWLFVNRISQTMYDPLADESKGEEKYFTYVYRIREMADSFPAHSKALLLGLGGGSIATNLVDKGFQVDACELDKRIAHVAKTYFGLPESVHISIDDARHFIRTCSSRYDMIVLDMFKGEDPPNHVFTLESMEELKQLLNPGGIVFVNSLGYYEGEQGAAIRAIYKTFQTAGFAVKVLPTDPDPNQRNLLFYASLDKIPTRNDFVPEGELQLQKAEVLTDERPLLDVLNAQAAMQWRRLAISSFNADPEQQLLPLFR